MEGNCVGFTVDGWYSISHVRLRMADSKNNKSLFMSECSFTKYCKNYLHFVNTNAERLTGSFLHCSSVNYFLKYE